MSDAFEGACLHRLEFSSAGARCQDCGAELSADDIRQVMSDVFSRLKNTPIETIADRIRPENEAFVQALGAQFYKLVTVGTGPCTIHKDFTEDGRCAECFQAGVDAARKWLAEYAAAESEKPS